MVSLTYKPGNQKYGSHSWVSLIVNIVMPFAASILLILGNHRNFIGITTPLHHNFGKLTTWALELMCLHLEINLHNLLTIIRNVCEGTATLRKKVSVLSKKRLSSYIFLDTDGKTEVVGDCHFTRKLILRKEKRWRWVWSRSSMTDWVAELGAAIPYLDFFST